jgi:hypothetical protein
MILKYFRRKILKYCQTLQALKATSCFAKKIAENCYHNIEFKYTYSNHSKFFKSCKISSWSDNGYHSR